MISKFIINLQMGVISKSENYFLKTITNNVCLNNIQAHQHFDIAHCSMLLNP